MLMAQQQKHRRRVGLKANNVGSFELTTLIRTHKLTLHEREGVSRKVLTHGATG